MISQSSTTGRINLTVLAETYVNFDWWESVCICIWPVSVKNSIEKVLGQKIMFPGMIYG